MTSFNDLLRASGLDPREVVLLRHSQKVGPLLRSSRADFERYHAAQDRSWADYCSRKLWASFLAQPKRGTLFVGLYRAEKDESRKIDWRCPLTGEQLGGDDDLYRLERDPQFIPLEFQLQIDWGPHFRRWIQYADRNDKEILTPAPAFPEGRLRSAEPDDASASQRVREPLELPSAPSPGSPEGKTIWRLQKKRERKSARAQEAKLRNQEAHGGRLQCEACGFQSARGGLFDAHHKIPLFTGERVSVAEDFAVLCPTCHRQAHLSPNRLEPYSLAALRAWAAAGRPDHIAQI